MHFFSADAIIFFKEKYFFGHENMKKLPSKVAYSTAKLFFSVVMTGPKPTKISNHVP